MAKRDDLPAEVRRELSCRITQGLLQLPCYRKAQVVLAYMNFGSEFASEEFVSQVLADGKMLILPRLKKDKSGLDLYHIVNIRTDLEPGVWGIREPKIDCPRLQDLAAIDFALLPGVAFGKNGERLGYGGGFYDRLLAEKKSFSLVAAAFSLQIAENIPVEENDIPVDIIVTENGEYFRRKEKI